MCDHFLSPVRVIKSQDQQRKHHISWIKSFNIFFLYEEKKANELQSTDLFYAKDFLIHENQRLRKSYRFLAIWLRSFDIPSASGWGILLGFTSFRTRSITWYLRCPIRGMPTEPRIFALASYEFQLVQGLYYKMVLCHILTWWRVT